jgi:hypothetical protein
MNSKVSHNSRTNSQTSVEKNQFNQNTVLTSSFVESFYNVPIKLASNRRNDASRLSKYHQT